ncbi:MAG: cupin domain-containing protein [Anaerolineales bacterium]|nr:cupin domain-containing protein [Anaerolineales bacterium]
MSNKTLRVKRWDGVDPAVERETAECLCAEGLHPYRWSNNPGDINSAHSHKYHKVIVVVKGSITFGLSEHAQDLDLNPGDRLGLPAGTRHQALVGPDGVVCLEAQH